MKVWFEKKISTAAQKKYLLPTHCIHTGFCCIIYYKILLSSSAIHPLLLVLCVLFTHTLLGLKK